MTRCDGPPGSEKTVLLIHGFGASRRHWRHNLTELAREAEVIALDLLGFGLSAKPRSRLADEPPEPGSVLYSLDLWAQQVLAAVNSFVAPGRQLHLIGNSIGAVVALRAACLLAERGRPPTQVVLIDCAQRTLDDKRLPATTAAGGRGCSRHPSGTISSIGSKQPALRGIGRPTRQRNT